MHTAVLTSSPISAPQPLVLWKEETCAEESLTASEEGILSLLKEVRGGNETSARRLVEELYPTVIRIIRSHPPDRWDEEDVAQEVFLKMFSKLSQYRGPQPFSHWVARITTNTCIDLLRRQKARPEVRFSDLSPAEEMVLRNASQSEPATEPQSAASSEGTEVVEKLLASLKPDQQLVMRLLDLERQSVKEICNQTGWSASKVKVTAMRARRKLAEVLGRLGKSLNL